MKKHSLQAIEKGLICVMILLGVIALIGGAYLIVQQKKESKDPVVREEPTTTPVNEGLSDTTVWLPDHLGIYQKLPEISFTDEAGTNHSISEFKGKPVVLVFWASWCKDCKEQMPLMNEYIALTLKEREVEFLFINKTDGVKETKESAIAYFKENNIQGHLFFDENLSIYDKLGLHNIPTTLFLDEKGTITAWSSSQISSIEEYEALLDKALYGGSYATETFVTSKMMDENGAIHTSYHADSAVTKQSDVLSESQGLLLEYAVYQHKKELFDQVLGYINSYMLQEGLTSWKVNGETVSSVNALIDDLRIYQALLEAQSLWGGYESSVKEYENRLKQYGLSDGKYVDFYDEKSKAYANRFTLCYGNLAIMKELGRCDNEFQTAYESALELVRNGQISKEFPLYYSWYDYGTNSYQMDDLNMAEAMVTLLHLAQVDQLPKNTLDWLRGRMSNDGVKVRYTVSGEILDGYDYESTAVYAIIAMIGVEVDDSTLVDKAIRKMEKMRIDNVSYEYNGAFGMEDGSGISSFDQIMPMLAYTKVYGR